jgi:hypothetical protein
MSMNEMKQPRLLDAIKTCLVHVFFLTSNCSILARRKLCNLLSCCTIMQTVSAVNVYGALVG